MGQKEKTPKFLQLLMVYSLAPEGGVVRKIPCRQRMLVTWYHALIAYYQFYKLHRIGWLVGFRTTLSLTVTSACSNHFILICNMNYIPVG